MVCLRNISVDTLHKGDTEDDDNNNNNNNNNNNSNNNNNNDNNNKSYVFIHKFTILRYVSS
jgi:hypothetical protein